MLDEFKRYLKKDGKSINTIHFYTDVAKEFMEWYEEYHSCEFNHLTRDNVLEFKYYLKYDKKYKSQTIKVKMSEMAKFNEFLVHFNIQNKMVM